MTMLHCGDFFWPNLLSTLVKLIRWGYATTLAEGDPPWGNSLLGKGAACCLL